MSQSRYAPGVADISGEIVLPADAFEAVGEPRPRVLSLAKALAEYRDHLPIWFVYIQAIGLLHALLANYPAVEFARLGIPRMAFLPTLLFSMSWFAGYMVLRIRRSETLESRRWQGYLGVALLAVGVPLLIAASYRPYPLSHTQLTFLYEWSQFIWVGLFVGQIAWKRGWGALVTFFGVTFVYGLLLENAGIVMRFFYEPSFRFYLGPLPAPMCTMLGWCVVFYIMFAITEQLADWVPRLLKSAGAKALTATAMALCLDAQLDPLASMSGVFWRWNELLPGAFLGVPLINFAAWFGAFLPFSYFLFRLRDREDLTVHQMNWELFLRVPLSCVLGGVLCFSVMAMWEGGFDGPSFQILGQFFSGLLPY